MKLKRVLAGILTGVMVTANIPSFGIDGIGLQQVQAEEAAGSAAPIYRYQSIQGMKAYAGWATRYDAPIENLLNDDTSVTYSRYNTGRIPRSTYISARNNIFIKLDEAVSVDKLSYYPMAEKASGGDGKNVKNGTFTRVNVYVSTEDIGDTPTAPSSSDTKWKLALENERLDSDTKETADGSTIPRNDIKFKEAEQNVKGICIQVLNTAGDYDGTQGSTAQDKDKRDTFISGRELEVYSGESKVENGKMTFSADFDCHSEDDAIGKLNDGDLSTAMHSVYEGDATYGTKGPVKTNEGHYFANNNMYFTLPESTQIGKLTYVAGTLNGNISRARIYVSNVELTETQTPADIHESAWLKVYDNTDDATDPWNSYIRGGTLEQNRTDAVFDSVQMARHVRVEVYQTQYSEDAAQINQVTNKWIGGRRVYIWAAEPLNQVKDDTNVALSKEAGGQAEVEAYTGVSQGYGIANLNNGTGDDRGDSSGSDLWLPGYDNRPDSGANKGKTNYVVLDLNATETDISEIALRWHAKAFATAYKIETSDTCRVSGDMKAAVEAGEEIDDSADDWTEVVNYTRTDKTVSYPRDEFRVSDGSLTNTKLKRYVRLSMSETNTGAAWWTAVREFMITGLRFQNESVKNVALGQPVDGITTTIKAYTAERSPYALSYINDGKGIDDTNNSDERWESDRMMKEGGDVNTPGTQIPDAVSYVIFDLGESTNTQLDSIRIRWHNMLYATDYVIQTSDFCDVEGNVGKETTLTQVNAEAHADKWETVAKIEGKADKGQSYPLDEFGEGKANPLEKTYLRRYVRLLVTKMNLNAGASAISVKEMEINGIRKQITLDTVELDWKFENTVYNTDGTSTTRLETTPRYGTIFRSPTTKAGAGYHIAGESSPVKWETSENGTDGWTAVAADGYFGFDKYYRGTVEVESLGAPFADVLESVTVNGSTDDLTVGLNSENGNLVVSKIYAPIANYTARYEALKTWFNNEQEGAITESAKEIREKYAEGQGDEITNNSWERFANTYKYVQMSLARDLTDEDGTRTAPGGFRLGDFEAGKAALISAYQRLTSSQTELELDHAVMVTIGAPENGEAPTDAKLTRGGSVVTKPDTLKPEPGDLEYSIGSENELKGNIKFPNGQGGNDIFNVKGTNQFLMNFDIYVPKKLDHTESIIGKFDKQYALQINADNIFLFGQLSGGWHQVNCSLSDDWYGKWHNVVAIYTGDVFQMYVDGKISSVAPGYDGRHGSLIEESGSTFAIGYNPDRRPNAAGSDHSNEGFSGGIRNIRMFIQNKDDQDDDFPNWQTALEGKTTEADIQKAFTDLLADKTPELEIGGEPASYEVAATRWKDASGNPVTTFDKYKEYQVEVDVTTLPGVSTDYIFKDNVTAEVSGLTAEEQAKVTYELSDDKDTITISYTFPRAQHPKDLLDAYLEGLAEELEVANAAENKDASDNRVYTEASWADYLPKYQAAVARQNDAISTDTEEACQTAYDELVAAVGNLNKAAETCECTLGNITFEGRDISLTEAFATEQMSASAEINHTSCMKHSADNMPALSAVYTIAEGSTEGIASIDGSTLTITGEGTIKVTAAVALKDGERTVAEKTTENPAVYTVTSPKATDVSDLQAAINSVTTGSYNKDDYTPESWQVLEDALEAAKELAKAFADGEEISEAAKQQAIKAIEDAIAALDRKGSETEDSVQDLRDLVTSISENRNKADYTDDSWNHMVAIFNQAVEEVNKTNPDPSVCASLLAQLKDADSKLVTKAQDTADAKTEVSSAVAAADAVYNAGQQNYTAESWKAFTDAYTAAKNAPANADAAALRKLAAALKAAQAALKADEGLKAGYKETVGSIQYKVLNADKKTVAAVKGMKKKATSVTIPATVTIKGVPCNVVQVGASAFKGYTKLKKVTIGKNVTTIGKQAFFGCKKLKTVKLKGKALKSIKKNAFKNTAKNPKVKWAKGMKAAQKKKLKSAMRKQGLKVK